MTRAKPGKGFRAPAPSACLILAGEVEMADALVRFLEKATEDPRLFEELIRLAAKYGIDLTELDDDQLGDVSGGTAMALDAAVARNTDAASDHISSHDAAAQRLKATIKTLTEHDERQSQASQKVMS
jgi:hypothetical protein